MQTALQKSYGQILQGTDNFLLVAYNRGRQSGIHNYRIRTVKLHFFDIPEIIKKLSSYIAPRIYFQENRKAN